MLYAGGGIPRVETKRRECWSFLSRDGKVAVSWSAVELKQWFASARSVNVYMCDWSKWFRWDSMVIQGWFGEVIQKGFKGDSGVIQGGFSFKWGDSGFSTRWITSCFVFSGSDSGITTYPLYNIKRGNTGSALTQTAVTASAQFTIRRSLRL